jgi:hypothetical protein
VRRGELLFVVLVVALMGAFGFADRFLPKPKAQELETEGGRFLSSGWYCPTPAGQGFVSQIGTTNLGEDVVRLRRWSIAGSQKSAYNAADLAPRRRVSIATSDLGLPDAAAVVEVFGADSTTDSITYGDGDGLSVSRCSVQPSDRWYFSVASTARGQDTNLLVANPFAEEAVLRVRIITAEKDVIPARLRDQVIPPFSQTPIFLAEFFEETEGFGLEVVATQGRVVVARYTRMETRDGRRGMFSDVGIREPSPRWVFAGGEVPIDGDEYFVLTNPGEREALAQFIFQTDSEQLSPPALAELAIPAGRRVFVKAGDHLPRGAHHGTTINVLNSIPVVAERLTFRTGPSRGSESTFGSPAVAKRFVVSVGSPIGGGHSIAIVNHSQRDTVVRITLITAENETNPPELSAIGIGAGRRLTVDVTPFLSGGMATAVIESLSGDIVAERHLDIRGSINDFASQPAQPLE